MKTVWYLVSNTDQDDLGEFINVYLSCILRSQDRRTAELTLFSVGSNEQS